MERLDIFQLKVVLQSSLDGGNAQKAKAAEEILERKEAALKSWMPGRKGAKKCPSCGSNSGSVVKEIVNAKTRLNCTVCHIRGPFVES